MADERAAAKRRASFGRADRLRKEEQQKVKQAETGQRRKAERDKADEQRKADKLKTIEQRNALARKRAEERRLERKKEAFKKEFNLNAENRRAREAKAEQQRKAEAVKEAAQKKEAEHDPRRCEAANYVTQQEKRQERDQLEEHRRQTSRMRAEHKAERHRAQERDLGAVLDHARKIRNIDIAERRELEAFDRQRSSLSGRVTEFVRGSRHLDRQEQAIVDRHESDRWQKHRDYEAKKDNLFWTAQAKRLAHAVERRDMAKNHEAERQTLKQSHERSRPQQIEARVQAVARANDNQQIQQLENKRLTQAFGHAAGQSHEIKR